MGTDVRIEIDRKESGGIYSNHDVIHGVVHLSTSSSLSLSYIQVKLEGVATTHLNISKKKKKDKEKEKDKDKKEKLLQDLHKVLYDSAIVFPPENIRNVSGSKDFTVNPGSYTYPFKFMIPLGTSCVNMLGFTNKVQLNQENGQIMVNNGNFNTGTIKNLFQINPSLNPTSPDLELSYHVNSQLPPSMDIGLAATIQYFVKVTCKRSSIFKANFRAVDPFTFLPLDLDSKDRPVSEGQQIHEYSEVYYRKEITFRKKLPEVLENKIPKKPESDFGNGYPIQHTPTRKKGFFSSLFSSRSRIHNVPLTNIEQDPNTVNVPFYFELRFKQSPTLAPLRDPTFQLFLMLEQNPESYSLAQIGSPEKSSGVGLVYLQKLSVELRSFTLTSVLEVDGQGETFHHGKTEEVIPIFNKRYENIEFDLFYAQTLRSSPVTSSNYVDGRLHEIEIPFECFEKALLPKGITPSFSTCNITQKYSLIVTAGFLSEMIMDLDDPFEIERKIRYVDVQCPDIRVLSGHKPSTNGYKTPSMSDYKSSPSVSRASIQKPQFSGQPSLGLTVNDEEDPFGTEQERHLPAYDDIVKGRPQLIDVKERV